MSVSRRSFLNAAPLALVPAMWPEATSAQAPGATAGSTTTIDASYPTQPADLARDMVGASHNNIARVKELLALHPTLARAAWDWGWGDWEDALGAASHVGNREIAALLVANGARPTIFSATMLGHLDVVKAFIAASPGIEATPGPHGIPLMAHATAGGAQAQAVAEYLKTLPGASKRPETQPLTPDETKSISGDYIFGARADERITIGTGSNNILTITRVGRSARNLFHIGNLVFFPSGAPLVRIRLSGPTLTIHDPDLVLTAKRA